MVHHFTSCESVAKYTLHIPRWGVPCDACISVARRELHSRGTQVHWLARKLVEMYGWADVSLRIGHMIARMYQSTCFFAFYIRAAWHCKNAGYEAL
jgi:hypothetical protein